MRWKHEHSPYKVKGLKIEEYRNGWITSEKYSVGRGLYILCNDGGFVRRPAIPHCAVIPPPARLCFWRVSGDGGRLCRCWRQRGPSLLLRLSQGKRNEERGGLWGAPRLHWERNRPPRAGAGTHPRWLGDGCLFCRHLSLGRFPAMPTVKGRRCRGTPVGRGCRAGVERLRHAEAERAG